MSTKKYICRPHGGILVEKRGRRAGTISNWANISAYELIIKEDLALKDKIHPQFHQATVTCACGNSFVTGSTKKTLKVDVCSKCHPFFTGVQKIVDTTGRLERFTKKFGLDKKEL
jgi:large subunit ribosomal protein L31